MTSHYRSHPHLTTILIFLVMVNGFIIDPAGAKKRQRQSRTIRLDLKTKMAELQCKQGEQIINVTIRSWDTKDCQGIPNNMFVDMCNCFWHERCSLAFDPTDYIIPNSKHSCPGRRVNALDINYSCKPAAKISLYDSSKWPKKEGILRSHEKFPWDDHRSLTSMKRSVSVGHRNRLVVTLFPYDLGSNQLFIGNYNFTRQSSVPRTIVINRETVVNFNFMKNDPNADGRGFVLCYKVLKMKKSYKGQTACELIKSRGKKSGRKRQKKQVKNEPEKGRKRKKKDSITNN